MTCLVYAFQTSDDMLLKKLTPGLGNEPIQPSLILASFFRGQRKSFDWNHKASALKKPRVWLLVNNIDIAGAKAWERAQFSQSGYSCDSNRLVIRTGSCHVTRLWMLFLSMILTGLAGLLPSHFLCLVQQFGDWRSSIGSMEGDPSKMFKKPLSNKHPRPCSFHSRE